VERWIQFARLRANNKWYVRACVVARLQRYPAGCRSTETVRSRRAVSWRPRGKKRGARRNGRIGTNETYERSITDEAPLRSARARVWKTVKNDGGDAATSWTSDDSRAIVPRDIVSGRLCARTVRATGDYDVFGTFPTSACATYAVAAAVSRACRANFSIVSLRVSVYSTTLVRPTATAGRSVHNVKWNGYYDCNCIFKRFIENRMIITRISTCRRP